MLDGLGVTWYIDYTADTSNIPAGRKKVIYINSVNPVPLQQINSAAAARPGSVWYVLGEPNAHGVSVADVVVGLHGTYAASRAADPSALITSPSLLNFDFTCTGCGGIPSGRSWVEEFRSTYKSLYGVEPPVDIWAIDVFPIIWPAPFSSAPVSTAFPTVRDDIVTNDITAFRSYLSAIPAQAGKPIWVTEFGLHWGFSD